MPTKEAIKRELDFSKNMAEILDIMKQVAQSQFTISKRVVSSTFGGLVVSFDRVFELAMALPGTHPLIKSESETIGVIVTTSDQSFMGALNGKIAKKAREMTNFSKNSMYLVCGRKGQIKFRFNKDPYVGFPAIKEGPGMLTLATEITDYALKEVCAKKIGKLYVVYAESNSFGSQVMRSFQLLPFSDLVKNREIFKKNQKFDGKGGLICSESSTKNFAEYVARLWMRNALFFIFRNCKPAEFSSLASQMEGSCDSVKKVIGKLSTMYKKAKNEKVDASMREIFVSTMVSGGG